MTRENALEIANEFLHYMNPDLWNGIGNPPSNFDTRIYEPEYEFKKLHLEIGFLYDDQFGWYTYVDLVDGGCQVEGISCERVNSPILIADCIFNICKWNII